MGNAVSRKTTTCPCCAAVCQIGKDAGMCWFEPLQERALRDRIAELERDVAILRGMFLRETVEVMLRDDEPGSGQAAPGWVTESQHRHLENDPAGALLALVGPGLDGPGEGPECGPGAFLDRHRGEL
jgi:hypothetical protein